MGINYSDGIQIEAKVRTLLTDAEKLDSSTAIAHSQYQDWPVRYHLSPERGNLLRPFNFSGLDVLELGAGMGAVSRLLAEQAQELTVIEGTESRFAALNLRLRDLNNWKGKIGNIGEVQLTQKFDVVCVIGVLEYSELYIKSTDGLTPFEVFLRKALSFLKDEGVLVLAIENKLGLKYWNGCTEDHTGRLYDGICGYSDLASPKTFSFKELQGLFTHAGLRSIDAYFPFPDYKVPTSLLSLDLMENFPSIAADLASYQRAESYGVPHQALFPEILSYQNLAGAGLLKDLANSFLFIGTANSLSKTRTHLLSRQLHQKEIAWHYSMNRKAGTETVFRKISPDKLEVLKSPLSTHTAPQDSSIIWKGTEASPVNPNPKLRLQIARHLYYKEHDSALNLIQDFLKWSFAHWSLPSSDSLKGQALDAVITNACTSGNYPFELFDLEWESRTPISKSWFILRNILSLRGELELLAQLNFKNLKEFYDYLNAHFEIKAEFEFDVNLEAELQSRLSLESDPKPFLLSLRASLLKSTVTDSYPREPHPEFKMRTQFAKIVQERDDLLSILRTPPHRIAKSIDKLLQKNPKIQRLVRFRKNLNAVWTKTKAFLPYVYSRYKIYPNEIEQKTELHPPFNTLKAGWVSAAFRFDSEVSAPGRLRLQLICDSKTLNIDLERTGPNTFGGLIRLYANVDHVQLPLSPVSAHLRQVSKVEAALRLISPQLPQLLLNSSLRADFLNRFKTLWAQGKQRGLIALIQQQALQGKVTFGDTYSSWILEYDTLNSTQIQHLKSQVSTLPYFPLISILMPVYNTEEIWLRKAIESVVNQIYPNWELCIADDGSLLPHIKPILEEYQKKDPRIHVVFREKTGHISQASNSALELASGEFIGLLDHDDELTPDALFEVVSVLNQNSKLDLIYSDEDKIDSHNRRFLPHFKPDWNQELFYSYNLITHFCVIRSVLIKELQGFRIGFEGSQDYDLFLRIIEKTKAIHHIPKILYHWRAILSSVAGGPSAKPYAFEAAQRALREHLERTQTQADLLRGVNDLHRVRYKLPASLALVSCVICTRDRIDLLKGIVDGLIHQTDYPNLEIIIIDNQSKDKETYFFFDSLSKDRRFKIIKYDAPFNFSAMNNLGVRHAQGPLIAILNNDLLVRHPEWLKEMVSFALQSRVGVVGAKLYYPSDRLQHAGVILGIGGVAGHSHKGLGKYHTDYQARTRAAQILSAVTAACLVVRKEVFEKVGGFDESNLPVAFNDIDLCLKIREAGYQNIWTPHAELTHLESESRGSDETPENQPRFKKEVEWMMQKWGAELKDDPFYNPNLTLERQDFSLAYPPRSRNSRPNIGRKVSSNSINKPIQMANINPPVIDSNS